MSREAPHSRVVTVFEDLLVRGTVARFSGTEPDRIPQDAAQESGWSRAGAAPSPTG
jgi:hypothetical protein